MYMNCLGADDWKCDQYRWFQNAIKEIPANDPIFKKRYYLNVTPDGKSSKFIRHSYSPLNEKENYVLIHYIGDHTTAVQFPHGNSKKKQEKPFIRTCPSVLSTAKKYSRFPSKCVQEFDFHIMPFI